MIAALYEGVTGRRGFPVILTLFLGGFWLLRVAFPDAPANADVDEQLWMSAEWRLGYGSGANPPLFTWLVKLVDAVVGSPAVSVEVVRFAFLWLFCFLTAHTVRNVTADDRLAALAGLAPLAVYGVGWEALFRHSNTMMLIASVPMTLAALQRLDRRADWVAYLLFALVTAFGFYSKYNYALVWGGFVAVALMDDTLRSRLLDRRMAVALLLAVLLLSPLLHWIATHLDGMLGHGRLRLEQRPSIPALPGRLSALVDLAIKAAGLVLPLFAFLLLLCPRAFLQEGGIGDGELRRWRRLIGRYLLIVAAMLVAAVLVLGMARFQSRYIYVLLPVLPLAFLRISAASPGIGPRRWLAAVLVGVILLVMAGAVYRGVTYAARHAGEAPPVTVMRS